MPPVPTHTYLRWVGGKHRLVSRLRPYVPADFHMRTYHEPFLGAASLFLGLQPKRAFLSDLNESLVRSFVHVRARPNLVGRYLTEHQACDSESYYYRIREQYNASERFSCAQAARFIYLNRACYNGVFRVNRQGKFNVPYGRRTRRQFPGRSHLRRVGQALRKAVLRTLPYQVALRDTKEGDFVYLDPPYPPLNGTSLFRHYTRHRFSLADQREVARVALDLKDRGCLVMISNADIPVIRRFYDGMCMTRLRVTRSVTCKNVRHSVSELIITTYGEDEMLGFNPHRAGVR